MNAVTQNRPVLAHARRVFQEYTALLPRARNAFGESCLELLRLDYEAEGSGIPFEQHLVDLGPIDMSRPSPRGISSVISMLYFYYYVDFKRFP
jgi:hypothetical protein